jgi:quercetin dioxygenase-like cupin family protein
MLNLNVAVMPFVRRMSAGGSLWYMGHLYTLLATGEDTEGQYALIDAVGARGNEPPRHCHHREDETYYLLEGQMTFTVGEVTIPARPGDCVFLPRGVPHSYRIETERSRALLLITPSGLENFFREFSQPATTFELPPRPEKPYDLQLIGEASAHYGLEWVPETKAIASANRPRYDLETCTPGLQAMPSGWGYASLAGCSSKGFAIATTAVSLG